MQSKYAHIYTETCVCVEENKLCLARIIRSADEAVIPIDAQKAG